MHRPAISDDAKQLFEIREKSIIALAPKGMSIKQAENWAANLTIAGMEQKIRGMEIWIAELDGRIVGWGAIRGDHLEGLYTDPECVGRGIGTGLLNLLEGLMRERGISSVHADASSNAEEFYFRRGYKAVGFRSPVGAQPITKRLPGPGFSDRPAP